MSYVDLYPELNLNFSIHAVTWFQYMTDLGELHKYTEECDQATCSCALVFCIEWQ